MNRYYYIADGKKHYITLKKAAPEWVNYDCPYIYDDTDVTVVQFDYFNKKIVAMNDVEVDLIKKFISVSDKAFCRKYPHLGYSPGNLIKDIHIL